MKAHRFAPGVPLKASLITLGLLGALTVGVAQTIPNPSFESNSFTTNPGYISVNTTIVGWTAGNNGAAGLNPANGNPFADNGIVPNGTNVAFIQRSATSSLSTVISNLTAGETYKVNFRVNARASSGSTPNLKVDIDGVNLLYAIVTNVESLNSHTNQYQYFAFDFTAAATNHTMTLRNDATPDATVLLDNFSIAVRNSGWSYAAWNDDASSGVVATNNYTHAYNFGSSSNAIINGKFFTGTGASSTNGNPSVTNSFSTTGLPNVFNNGPDNVTGASALLANDFLWGGAVQSITLYGLTIGKSYVTTIYSVGFDTNFGRAATFSVGNDRLTVNQDQFGQGHGIWVSYFFTAASTSNTITYTPLDGANATFHTYGFANYESPPLQIVNPSFEADTFTVSPGYASNNFPITGWNGFGRYGVNSGGGTFTDNGAIPDGAKTAFIEGDTNGNGMLTQVIHGFTNGASYQVRYFENARNCCSNVPFAEVRVGGQTVVAAHAVSPVGGANQYHRVWSDAFIATDTSLELAFVKSDPQGGDNTLLIDNVSISPVISGQAPVTFTLPADAIVSNSARLNGQVSPQGMATTAWFQWGTDTNYGNLTLSQAVGSGWALSNLNVVLGGLLPGVYHYQLVARQAFVTNAGVDQSFTIPSFYALSIPGLPQVYHGSVAWGDYDNDGRLDFLITGTTNGQASGAISQLWRNTGNCFTNVPIPGLPQVAAGSVAWGDFDNDGRLDFLITGLDNNNNPTSQLWRNNLAVSSDAPPAAPAGLTAAASGTTVFLNWNAPADDHTPAAGLSYNLRIGTTPGASDVLAPMALTSGQRLLPALGNAQTGTSAFYDLSRLAPGSTYYWSVQALDTSFAGSPFAAESQLTTGPLVVNPIHFPGGAFEFYFTNQSVVNFDILVSTNISLPVSNWTDLGPAISLGGGYYQFTDTNAIGQPRRFYLLRKH